MRDAPRRLTPQNRSHATFPFEFAARVTRHGLSSVWASTSQSLSTSMAVTNLPQHKPSRELSVAAIKEAHAQLDSTGQNLGKLAKPNTRSTDQRPRAGPDKPARRLLRSKILSRRLVGLLALAGIGVTALVWQPHLEAAPEPPILSMLDANRDASPPIHRVSPTSPISQPMPQSRRSW